MDLRSYIPGDAVDRQAVVTPVIARTSGPAIIRTERHQPDLIATLHRGIAVALARNLQRDTSCLQRIPKRPDQQSNL